MNMLTLLIILPFIVGLFVLFLRKKEYLISVIMSFVMLCYSIFLFTLGDSEKFSFVWLKEVGISFGLGTNFYSGFCILLSSFFTFLICLFSVEKINFFNVVSKNVYFSLMLINLAVVNGVFLSTNFITLLVFWELAGIMLYFFVRFVSEDKDYFLATKALYIIGFTDFCLLLGILFLYNLSGSFDIGQYHYSIDSVRHFLSLFFITVGALGKIGSLPVHNWIPYVAKKIPATILAYLVASLDKILGIYLLSLVWGEIFVLPKSGLLMLVGLLTILVAVFMALVQHNLKKLLSYHAISQVGYMILGVGTGTVVGFAGGILHMINNVVYKTCLFLSCASVEDKTGDVELSQSKGLAKFMPITFFVTLIAALSISGVPPLNGFFSKWMIYQGLVEGLQNSVSGLKFVYLICLIGAMFGSALTLASFIKVIYSLFLEENKSEQNSVKGISEVKWHMLLPMILLSLLCVIFGIFAYEVVIDKVIVKVIYHLTNFDVKTSFIGGWVPFTSTLLILLGLGLGVILYFVSRIKGMRKVPTYLGGEESKVSGTTFPATDFYLSVSEIEPLKTIYFFAQKRVFDFYNWGMEVVVLLSKLTERALRIKIFDIYKVGKEVVIAMGGIFSELHIGNLHFYLSWVIIGAAIIFLIFLR